MKVKKNNKMIGDIQMKMKKTMMMVKRGRKKKKMRKKKELIKINKMNIKMRIIQIIKSK